MQIMSGDISEMVGMADYDFCAVDMEHTDASNGDLSNIYRGLKGTDVDGANYNSAAIHHIPLSKIGVVNLIDVAVSIGAEANLYAVTDRYDEDTNSAGRPVTLSDCLYDSTSALAG